MNEQEFWRFHHERIKTSFGMLYEYRIDVSKRIGRPVKPEEIIHHHYNWDGSITYVLCDSKSYHHLLHRRGEALRICSNANWRKCTFCKQYDDPKNMTITNQNASYHQICCNEYGSRTI